MLLREAYSVLGVQPGIDVDEIRSRYRLLVKELHPDVNAGSEDELARIIEAYRLLDSKYRAFREGVTMRMKAKGEERRSPRRPTQRATSRAPERPNWAANDEKTRSEARQWEPWSPDREPSSPDRQPSSPDRQPWSPDRQPPAAAVVFRLGRVAVGAADSVTRCAALDRLAATGLRSAAVFITQCIFDTDQRVAEAAARALPRVPGVRGEQALIELFDQLSVPQCVAMIETVTKHRLGLNRFLAYAAADPRLAVRLRAMEVLRG